MNKIILTAFLFLPSVIPSFGAAVLINNFSFEAPTTGAGTFLTGPDASDAPDGWLRFGNRKIH